MTKNAVVSYFQDLLLQDMMVPVTGICHCKNMRTQLSKSSTFILFHHTGIIQVWKFFERIDSNQYIRCVCLSIRCCSIRPEQLQVVLKCHCSKTGRYLSKVSKTLNVLVRKKHSKAGPLHKFYQDQIQHTNFVEHLAHANRQVSPAEGASASFG